MRSLALWSFLSIVGIGLAASAVAEDRPGAPTPQPKLEFLYVEITGATGDEVGAIAKALGSVGGVRSFTWTVEGSEAKVVREVGTAPDATLLEKARSAGAETAAVVPLSATTFTFDKKLHCGGCVSAVTKALRKLKGVKESSVPAEMTTVTVVYDSRAVKPADVEAALSAIRKPAKAPAP